MSRFYFLIFAFLFFVSVQSVPAAHYNLSNYNYGMINSETIRLHKKTILEDHYEEKKEIKVAIPSSQRRFARSVLKNENSRWPSPIIPFEISPNMSAKGVKMIHKAMRHYQNLTCLIFKPKSDLDKDYIYFDNRPGACISDSTGRKGGRQDINLDEKYCLNTSELAIHEIFHTLGFNHEHTRPDRDDHITVHWENIMPAANHSFMKEKLEDVDTLGLPYDYRSIVHIHAFGGSINGNATLSVKVPNQTLGSTGRLSELDVRKINILFKCNDSFSTTPTLPGTNKPVEITTSTPQTESTTTMKPRTESTTTTSTTMKPKTESTTTTTTTTTTTMKPKTESTTTATTTTTTRKPQTKRTTTTTKKPQTKRITTTTTTTTTTKKPQTKRTTTTTTTTPMKPQTRKPQTKKPVTTTMRPQTRTTTVRECQTRRPQTKKPTKKPATNTMRPRPRRTTVRIPPRRTTTRRPPTRKPVTTTPKPKTCRNDCYFFYFCIGYVVCAVTSALDWVWGLWC